MFRLKRLSCNFRVFSVAIMSRAGQGSLAFKAALSELQCANSLVGSQIDAGMDEKDVVASKFKSFSGRFDALPTLTIAQVTELTNASNAGPWGGRSKNANLHAV